MNIKQYYARISDEYSIRFHGPFATQEEADEWKVRYEAGEVTVNENFIPHSARLELAMHLGHGGPIREPRKYFHD